MKINIPEDLYWVMVGTARDELDTVAQKIQSLTYTIGLNGYEISELELVGILKYCKIDLEEAKPMVNRVFGSGVLKLTYPTGELIDPESEDFAIGLPDPLALKEDIERRIRELLG